MKVSEILLTEAWDKPAEINDEKKGMFAGKTLTQLQHELNALLKAGPHPKDSRGYTKVKELEFAIRSKKAKGGKWGGVHADNKAADEEDCSMTMEQVTYELAQLDETLSKSAKAKDWIHDFVHSKNKKFKGKSKKQRIKQALGAYYAQH